MKKLLATICLATMSLVSAPAFAADDDAAKNTVLIPVRILAFGVGAVIGTPVAIVKKTVVTVQKHDQAIAEKMGGKDNTFAAIVAGPPALVSGAVVGTALGLYSGPKNAVDNCVEHPFSVDSMSLGEDK